MIRNDHLVCWRCGAPEEDDRKACRYCGTEYQAPTMALQLPVFRSMCIGTAMVYGPLEPLEPVRRR